MNNNENRKKSHRNRNENHRKEINQNSRKQNKTPKNKTPKNKTVKNKTNNKKSGSELFEEYYSGLIGKRWPKLKKALLDQSEKNLKYRKVSDKEFLQNYFINQASFFPVKALDLKPGDNFIDLCAAPGGKTLVSLLFLKGKGSVTANEFSQNRRLRLLRVLREHLSDNYLSIIKVTGYDASTLGLSVKNQYDKILVDAPCSGESHTLLSPKHLDQWSPGRSSNLAIKQFSILASALEMVKPGGTIVYSTCSVNSNENDGVIEKLLKKREGQFSIVKIKGIKGQRTKYGMQIFPDKFPGKGPIYFVKIKKSC